MDHVAHTVVTFTVITAMYDCIGGNGMLPGGQITVVAVSVQAMAQDTVL